MSGFKFSFVPPTATGDESSKESSGIPPPHAADDNKVDRFVVPAAAGGGGQQHDHDRILNNPLSSIDISATMSTMKSPPLTWNADRIQLSHSRNNSNIGTTSSTNPTFPTFLKRIAIHEKPFEEPPSVNATTNASPTESDDVGGGIITNPQRQRRTVDSENTDLIPGYYEGGLKVWECSIDLCHHLFDLVLEHRSNKHRGIGRQPPQSQGFQNDISGALGKHGSSLELGCGHGLPACVILRELFRECVESFSSSRSQCEDLLDAPRVKANASTNTNTNANTKAKAKTTAADPDHSDGGPVVVFTDYNHFVLKDVTLPNIILNCTGPDHENDTSERILHQYHMSMGLPLDQYCSLISGDWLELSTQLQRGTLRDVITTPTPTPNPKNPHPHRISNHIPQDGKFDLILAAETTYTPSSASDTAYLLMHHLKPDVGVGFIATKRYYFGVGGGSDAFRDAAARQTLDAGDGCVFRLKVDLVKEYNDGKSNIRDLWRVQCIRQ